MCPSSGAHPRTLRGRSPARGAAADGYSLIELATAVALASLVVALAGSVFVASLGLWRRGQEIREAEAQAAVIADAMARDVRRASQASQVRVGSPFSLDSISDGTALLSVPESSSSEEGGTGRRSPRWIIYVFDEASGRVQRLTVSAKEDGAVAVDEERVVGLGVTRAAVVPQNGGVVIEVEVKRGRATARQRVTAAPRNP